MTIGGGSRGSAGWGVPAGGIGTASASTGTSRSTGALPAVRSFASSSFVATTIGGAASTGGPSTVGHRNFEGWRTDAVLEL